MRKTALLLAAATFAVSLPQASFAQTGGGLFGGLFTCAATGQNQNTAAAVGAILGALAGTQVARNEQTLGGIGGAALGAMAGSWIGCRMSTTDQTRAQTAMQTALTTGQAQTWTNAQTGTSGRVDVYQTASTANAFAQPRNVQVQAQARTVAWRDLRYADGVNTAGSEFQTAPGFFSSNTAVNIRANPGTRALSVGRIPPGEVVEVVGHVNSGDWLVVERNGVVQGYVAETAIRQVAAPYIQQQQPVQQVAAGGDCREVQQTFVTTQYGQQSERYRACRDLSVQGGWSLTRLS